MLVGKDGTVQCSTLNIQVGLNVADRDYFRKAQETRDFVFSDYLFGKTNNRPIMTGTTFSRVSYDIPGQLQRFARARAFRDAEDRAANEIAENIQTRLASFFYAGT